MDKIIHETFYVQDEKRGRYVTRELTDFHRRIHESPKTTYALTRRLDPTIDWALGMFSLVIRETRR